MLMTDYVLKISQTVCRTQNFSFYFKYIFLFMMLCAITHSHLIYSIFKGSKWFYSILYFQDECSSFFLRINSKSRTSECRELVNYSIRSNILIFRVN